MDPRRIALMEYLRSEHTAYYAKVLELRDAISTWLSYIPQTFPHYTLHTVEHSDEILLQISKLLFRDDDPQKCVVHLSPIEAYIAAAAAYLHDAGMVTSDQEKKEILASDSWKEWTTDGGAKKRWQEIHQLREGENPTDDALRNFLADVQTRFLVAEFARGRHALRTTSVIAQHQGVLGRFAFDNPVLLRTIADVCLGHSLRLHELEDKDRYPDQRDIMEDQANVRFVTVLLRLGDLLDMSSDRACPLLLNAANPLPAESLAHWSQYQRVIHRLTTPDRIEITAECKTQDEHRVLQDWCQWIVDEVKGARSLVVRSVRHRDWVPPVATIQGGSATIVIRPALDATYVASKWHFEFDQEAVLQRLISDAYDTPYAFIRELIQNALDATRCQMYHDLSEEGSELPDYPTQVGKERRQRYPVTVSLEVRDQTNEMSGEVSQRQVLIVDDAGIGMDRDIIERYFLQIGRSYYTTEEFRRVFRFIPTSRFGVGFLSVFAVSDQVIVETYKPTSPMDEGPIRLTLTGPRSYLLREHGLRRSNGTKIEVVLRELLNAGELTRIISGWCRRVEFPVVVDDLGVRSRIEAERSEDFVHEVPDVIHEGAKFVVRAFPINASGVEGELYVLAYVGDKGESWAEWNWARYRYPNEHPGATVPQMPGSIVCVNGILITGGYSGDGPISSRLDLRGPMAVPTLGRRSLRYLGGVSEDFGDPRSSPWQKHIDSRLESALRDHLVQTPLAAGIDAWLYKQRLVDGFPLPSFWAALPGTLRVHSSGRQELVSLRDAEGWETLTTVLTQRREYGPYGLLNAIVFTQRREYDPYGVLDATDTDDNSFASYCQYPVLTSRDVARISEPHRAAIFRRRQIRSIRWLPSKQLAVDWSLADVQSGLTQRDLDKPMELAELPEASIIGYELHKTTSNVYGHAVLNKKHPLVQWLVRVGEAAREHSYGVDARLIDRLLSLMQNPVRYQGHECDKLEAYVRGWRDLPGLPAELVPPDIKLNKEMFTIPDPQAENEVPGFPRAKRPGRPSGKPSSARPTQGG